MPNGRVAHRARTLPGRAAHSAARDAAHLRRRAMPLAMPRGSRHGLGQGLRNSRLTTRVASATSTLTMKNK